MNSLINFNEKYWTFTNISCINTWNLKKNYPKQEQRKLKDVLFCSQLKFLSTGLFPLSRINHMKLTNHANIHTSLPISFESSVDCPNGLLDGGGP
jgi:hypothetical protein